MEADENEERAATVHHGCPSAARRSCQCSSSRAKSNVNGLCCPWCVRGVPRSPHNPANAPPIRSALSSACRTRCESVIKRDWVSPGTS